MELPDTQTRMEKLLTLWNKCDGYLVLVENGTVNGFQLINEAREFLLQQARFGEEPAHLFAPVKLDFFVAKHMNFMKPSPGWVSNVM